MPPSRRRKPCRPAVVDALFASSRTTQFSSTTQPCFLMKSLQRRSWSSLEVACCKFDENLTEMAARRGGPGLVSWDLKLLTAWTPVGTAGP